MCIYNYNVNKLFSLHWVIELRKNVLILRRDENDLSAVELDTGNVKYAICLLHRASISLWFIPSAMVLTFLIAVLSIKAVLIMSGSIESWTFKRD